jgi:hypothetical protein
MKVLLDECIPRKLKNSLSSHDCRTAPEEGLAGKKNGTVDSRGDGRFSRISDARSRHRTPTKSATKNDRGYSGPFEVKPAGRFIAVRPGVSTAAESY